MAREKNDDFEPSGNPNRINSLNSYITNVSKASDSVIISQRKLIASQAGTISAFKLSATKLNKTIDDVGMASKNMMISTAKFTRDSLRDFKRSLQEEFNVNKPNLLGMSVARAFGPIVGFMATKFAQSGIIQNLKEKTKEKFSDWRENRRLSKREKVERLVDEGMSGGVHIPKMKRGGITKSDTLAQIHKGEAVIPLEKYFTIKGSNVFKMIHSQLNQIRIAQIIQTGRLRMYLGNLFENSPVFKKLYKTYMVFSTVLSAPRKLLGILFKPRGGYIKDLPKRGSAADQTAAILGMIYTTGMMKYDSMIYYLKAIATKIVPGLKSFDEGKKDTYYSRLMKAGSSESWSEKLKILSGQDTKRSFSGDIKTLLGIGKRVKDNFKKPVTIGGKLDKIVTNQEKVQEEEKKKTSPIFRLTGLIKNIGKQQRESTESTHIFLKDNAKKIAKWQRKQLGIEERKVEKKTLANKLKEAWENRKYKKKQISLLERTAEGVEKIEKSKKGLFGKLISYAFLGISTLVRFFVSKFLAPFKMFFKMVSLLFTSLKPILGFLMKSGGKFLLKSAGVGMTLFDSAAGFLKRKEWGTSGMASTIGGLIGGTEGGMEGALKGMAKGASIGMFFGPVGSAIGALFGGLTGFIGGKKIAKSIDWVKDLIVNTWDTLKKFFEKISNAAASWAKTAIPKAINFIWKMLSFFPRIIYQVFGMISKFILDKITEYIPGGNYIRNTDTYRAVMNFLDSLGNDNVIPRDIIRPAESTTKDIARIETQGGIMQTQALAAEQKKALEGHASTVNKSSGEVVVAVNNINRSIESNNNSQGSSFNGGYGGGGSDDPGAAEIVSGNLS